jgi:hypothetical protein
VIEAATAVIPSPARRHKPRRKPERTVKLLLPMASDGSGTAVIEITLRQGRKEQVADYFVRRIGSDWGDGYLVEKIGGTAEEHYHTHLSDEGHTCDCKWHLAHGHCKHTAALVALRTYGLIF